PQRVIFHEGVFIHRLILAAVFALGSEECHNGTSARKGILPSVVPASVRLAACHAKMNRWK
ncbi:MAG TPA: hypothetical protein VGP12_04600, partial [Nitrosospira sp.]|nr:hypothetical protein [Nitrosospira sp.]